jgi:hypothetical protein
MDKKYFGIWDSRDDIIHDLFQGTYDYAKGGYVKRDPDADFPNEDEILYAAYGTGSYCGSAYILFERDGRFYEYSAGHCSCYGLEDTWKFQETDFDTLNLMPRNDPYYGIGTKRGPADDLEPEAIDAWWALVDSRLNLVH